MAKTPQKTLDRVRDNQRRHRQRRRDYIGSLEFRLAGAQRQIAELREECRRLSSSNRPVGPMCMTPMSSFPACSPEPVTMQSPPADAGLMPTLPPEPFSNDALPDTLPDDGQQTLDVRNLDAEPTDRPSCCASTAPQTLASTTLLCTEAYSRINQHNLRGLSDELISQWLEPGFHWSGIGLGQECRVALEVFSSLMNFISNPADQ